MLKFVTEPLSALLEDPRRELLWAEHFFASSRSYEATLKADVDINEMLMLEANNQLIVVNARQERDSLLMGYCVMVIRQSSFLSCKMAFDHGYFLTAEARGGRNALRLIEAAQSACAARGVNRMYITTKEHNGMGRLLNAMRWKKIDSIYVMPLKPAGGQYNA